MPQLPWWRTIRLWVWILSLLPVIIFPLLVYLLKNGNFGVRNKAATPATLTVCLTESTNCQYVGVAGIQQAIDAAKTDDIISLSAGTYTFTGNPTAYADVYVNRPNNYKNVASNRRLLVKDKALTIVGVPGGQTIVDFGSSEYGLVLENAGNTIVQDIFFRGIASEQTPTSPEGGAIVVRQLGSATGTVTIQAVYVTTGSVTIPSGKVPWSHGVVVKDKGKVLIKNSVFKENTGTGVLGFDQGVITIHNSLMVANNDGTQNSNSGALTVVNSVIAKNTAARSASKTPSGIICGQSAQCTISYSVLFNNTNGNTHTWSGGKLTQGSGMLTSDPGLTARTSAYGIWQSFGMPSVGKGVGAPDIKNPDNAPSDIGLFGGPKACLVDTTVAGCAGAGTPTATVTATVTASPVPSCTTVSPADYDQNCKVDISDYQVFVGDYQKWLKEKVNTPRSDFNTDQKVGVADYERFVTDYLASLNAQ